MSVSMAMNIRHGSTRSGMAGLVRSGLLALALVGRAHAADAGQGGTSPVVENRTITSLHRATAEWNVHTSVCLTARDDDNRPDGKPPGSGRVAKGEFTFTIVGGRRTGFGILACSRTCGTAPEIPDDADTLPNAPLSVDAASVRCVYQPDVGFVGDDSFLYTATDPEGHVSHEGRVDIQVRNQGLRWEVVAGASDGHSSDSGTPADAAELLNDVNQDVMFILNWQAVHARKANEAVTKRAAGIAAAAAQLRPPQAGGTRGSRNANVLFRIGWLSDPASVNATPVSVNPGEPPQGTATNVASTERHFTTAGQVNFNWVSLADSHGTFVELGVTGRGAIDVYPSSDDRLATLGGRPVRIFNPGKTVTRFEAGLRFALKQYDENPASRAVKGDKIVHLDNIDDFVLVEAQFQKNPAFEGLAAPGELDATSRFVLRVTAQPKFGDVPGRPKPAIGVEIGRAGANPFKSGGPWMAKILYGVNLSGAGLF